MKLASERLGLSTVRGGERARWIDSGFLDQHASVRGCRASEWCGKNPVGCVVLSSNLCMVTFYYFIMVLGELCSVILYGCRPIPGVVGFSFSGLTFCHASCLKHLRADCQGTEEW